MSVIDVAAALREILVAEAPDTAAVSVSADTLVSETAAGNPPLSAVLVYREALVADRPETFAAHASAEALVAEQPARDIPLMTTLVMREVLAYEGIAFIQSAGREVALSLPDDPLTVHALLTHASSAALQQREYLHPAAYISEESVGSLVQQIAQIRPSLPHWSPTRVTRLAELAAMSRTQAYQPIAAVRVTQQRQLVLQGRTVQPEIGFPQVRSFTSMSAVSFVRPIPPTANWVYQVRELAAQERLYGPIEGDRYAGTAAQLVAALRVTEPPFTQALVAQVTLLGAAARDMGTPFGVVEAGQGAQLAAQQRAPEAPYGPPLVGQHIELAAVQLQLLLNEGPRDVGSASQLTAVGLQLPPPSAVTGLNYAAAAQLASRHIGTPWPGDVRGPIDYAQAVVQYALGRTVVPPDQVENPEIGCHVPQLTRLAAQFRPYPPPPPPEDGALRLRSLAGGVVLSDETFPAPPFPAEEVFGQVYLLWQVTLLADATFLPQSILQVSSIEQRVTIGDAGGWIDPLEPQSEVRVSKLDGSAVLGDTSLPPADQSQSEVRVSASAQFVTMGETTLPPADVPQTDVRVFAGIEWVVFEDQSLPIGPQSVARVGQVGQHCLLRDSSVIGLDEVSHILCSSIGQVVVLRDRSMSALLARRPRPVASIAITI